jgi:hypothetical protein
MQTDKKIYIALAVLVVLAGLLYMQSQKSKTDTASHALATSSASLPTVKVPSDDVEKITKLVVKNAEKEEVVLEKRDDKWWLVKPIEAIANQQNVKSAVESLKEIKATDVINDTPQASAMYKDYQLEGDKVVHVSAFKGAEKAFDGYFGKSGSRGQMARFAAAPAILVVSGYSSFQFAREIKAWRNTEITKFEDANVIGVSITNEEGEYSFSKNGDTWAATFNKKTIDRFDGDKIKDMLRAYKNLNAEDFADGKADADMGLDKPAATVVITLKDNAGTIKLVFGKVSTGTSRFARKEGDKVAVVLGNWASDWAVAKAEKFQKPDPKDAGADAKGDAKDSKPAMQMPMQMPDPME